MKTPKSLLIIVLLSCGVVYASAPPQQGIEENLINAVQESGYDLIKVRTINMEGFHHKGWTCYEMLLHQHSTQQKIGAVGCKNGENHIIEFITADEVFRQ